MVIDCRDELTGIIMLCFVICTSIQFFFSYDHQATFIIQLFFSYNYRGRCLFFSLFKLSVLQATVAVVIKDITARHSLFNSDNHCHLCDLDDSLLLLHEHKIRENIKHRLQMNDYEEAEEKE